MDTAYVFWQPCVVCFGLVPNFAISPEHTARQAEDYPFSDEIRRKDETHSKSTFVLFVKDTDAPCLRW